MYRDFSASPYSDEFSVNPKSDQVSRTVEFMTLFCLHASKLYIKLIKLCFEILPNVLKVQGKAILL